MIKTILKSPSRDETIAVFIAWRVWILGALLGGIAGFVIFEFWPPAYRAQATVLIDHNVEQVIPQEETDRNRFYYLQQENDKLVVIAWSDDVLSAISEETGIPVRDLRDGRLHLSQPGEGGWHFQADDAYADLAARIAMVWAESFHQAVLEKQVGIAPTTDSSLAQAADLPVDRAVSRGTYVFVGSTVGVLLIVFVLLFLNRKEQ